MRFIFILGYLLFFNVAPALAESPADRVWRVLITRDPKIAPQETFVRKYVAIVDSRLKPFEKFAELIEGKSQEICNLLCQERGVTKGFRLGPEASSVDLMLYVLTQTCYGVIPDDEHRQSLSGFGPSPDRAARPAAGGWADQWALVAAP